MKQGRWKPVKHNNNDIETALPLTPTGPKVSNAASANDSGSTAPSSDTTADQWPATWKVALVIMIMCALFVGGIFIGYYLKDDPVMNAEDHGEGSDPFSQMCSDGSLDPESLLRIHKLFPDLILKFNREEFIR